MEGSTINTPLFEEFDRLTDAIENASVETTWELADWLAENVPPQKPGPKNSAADSIISLKELANHAQERQREGFSYRWLAELHRAARDFPADARVDAASVSAHVDALNHFNGDKEAALAALRIKTGSREYRPSKGGTKDAVGALEDPNRRDEVIAKLSPEAKAEVTKQLVADPQVTKDKEVAEAIVEATASDTGMLIRAQNRWNENNPAPEPKKIEPSAFSYLADLGRGRELKVEVTKFGESVQRLIAYIKKQTGPLPETTRLALLEDADQYRAAAELARRYAAEIELCIGQPSADEGWLRSILTEEESRG